MKILLFISILFTFAQSLPLETESQTTTSSTGQHKDKETLPEINLKWNKDTNILSNQLNSLKIFNVEKIQPPDHIDGLPIENDGHLNKDFKKEILMAHHDNDHHKEFDDETAQDPDEVLKNIFKKADRNKDGFLNTGELFNWMKQQLDTHLENMEEENDEIFKHLDINKDGRITWSEWSLHFILARAEDKDRAIKLIKNDQGVLGGDVLKPQDKEKLIKYKFRWEEAKDWKNLLGTGEQNGDAQDDDNGLSKREFMNFRHPEQNSEMIHKVAINMLKEFDSDEDGKITEDEFVEPRRFHRPEEDEDLESVGERRLEFRDFIDVDRSGKVDVTELKKYVDPRNVNRMRIEAENLLMLADEDRDKKLSLSEVLRNSELILGSKMVAVNDNFHDEF